MITMAVGFLVGGAAGMLLSNPLASRSLCLLKYEEEGKANFSRGKLIALRVANFALFAFTVAAFFICANMFATSIGVLIAEGMAFALFATLGSAGLALGYVIWVVALLAVIILFKENPGKVKQTIKACFAWFNMWPLFKYVSESYSPFRNSKPYKINMAEIDAKVKKMMGEAANKKEAKQKAFFDKIGNVYGKKK